MKAFRILDRYIIRKFIVTFVVALALIIAIVIAVDLSENIQGFLDKNVPVSKIISGYYLNFIPYFVNLFIPLFTFISVIFFTSKLSGNSEIIAMSNGGMSFYRMLYPYLVTILLIGSVSFYMDNYLIPKTSKNMMIFKEHYVSKQVRSKDMDTHIRLSPNSYAYVHFWDMDNQTGYTFWYEVMDDKGVRYQLDAQTIHWDSVNSVWNLNHYTKRWFDGPNERFEQGERMDTVLPLKVSDLVYIKRGAEIMTTPEIRRFVQVERAKGSDAIPVYEVELQRRMTGPVSVLILTIVGVCVTYHKTREGMGLHLRIGLVITFSFVLLQQMSQVFAVYGGVSPLLSVWIPDVIYGVLCVVLIIYVKK
ncbi:MAG: LptF/LptG family permease [Bacteroidales bacterium]|nr:LptF/LptG family permease [Bacteroidales bacterium]